MKRWQRECIDKNLSELIKNTLCNVILLAILRQQNAISDEEQLDLQDDNRTNQKRSSDLYSLLKTRKNGFTAMMTALGDTQQSTAFAILDRSLNNNEQYAQYSKLSYNDLDLVHQICNTITIYKGNFGTRDVMVKVYNSVITSRIDVLEQAKNELNFLTKLDSHENIVRCFIGKHVTKGGIEYFATALDYQMNLVTFSENNDITVYSDTLIRQVLNGGKFLHQNRILHMNIKPESIFVSQVQDFTKFKIGEFGLSRKLTNETENCTIIMGTLNEVGASSLLTPEVTACVDGVHSANRAQSISLQVGFPTDVFCLAIVIYFALSGGHHAFGGLINRQYNVHNNLKQVNAMYLNRLPLSDEKKFLLMLAPSPADRPLLANLVDEFIS